MISHRVLLHAQVERARKETLMIKSTTGAKADESAAVPLVVYFVRHGHAGGPDINEVLGPPLTRLGEHQAARVAERLAT